MYVKPFASAQKLELTGGTDYSARVAVLQGTLPVIALVAIAWLAPQLGSRWLRMIEVALRRASRQECWAIAGVGVLSLVLNVAVSAVVRPYPRGQDEFSYVLAGDTFSHGRLTNPTHPLWVHFESMHIIQQPTYASKYPPAQGLSLALGQALCGRQLAGVWLSTALACAAITWMLYAWLPAPWALLGGLLTAVHPMMIVWSQSFMGGTVAATGGAMVIGALRRLAETTRIRAGLVLGAGMSILANSRPYEGLVLCVLCAIVWVWLCRKLPTRPMFIAAAVLAIAIAWMGYYNWRVIGNPFRMPYVVHDQTYQVGQSFVWRAEPPAPTYRHKVMRDQELGPELNDYRMQRTLGGWLRACRSKLQVALEGFFPVSILGLPMWLLFVPLVALPAILRSRWMRAALVLVTGAIAADLLVMHLNMHYVAPVFGVVVLFAVQAARHVQTWQWRGRRWGRLAMWLSALFCYLSVLPTTFVLMRSYRNHWGREREQLLRQLTNSSGRHLVVVRYSDGHSPFDEWVYNAADIDSAPVVWAHEMDAEENRKLLAYFNGRHVWLLEADALPRRLFPYPMPADL